MCPGPHSQACLELFGKPTAPSGIWAGTQVGLRRPREAVGGCDVDPLARQGPRVDVAPSRRKPDPAQRHCWLGI